jgi:hypothetical protein
MVSQMADEGTGVPVLRTIGGGGGCVFCLSVRSLGFFG